MPTNKHLRFIKQWFIHATIVWVLLNAFLLISYWVRVQTEGNYLIKQDGTFVTVWDRFLSINYYQNSIFIMVFVTLLVEFGFHYFFDRTRFSRFTWYAALAGILFLLYLHFFMINGKAYDVFAQYMTAWLFIFGYIFLYAILRDFFIRRKREAQLLQNRQEAELRELRTQVNPHFFFNTLNSVYGLALEEGASRTSDAVEKLSEMMRYIMNSSSKSMVSIKDEFDFIRNYIDLQKLRVGDDSEIQLDIDISNSDSTHQVAPLLLIPFIENAFQYGISRNRKSFIRLSLSVTNDILTLNILNSVNPDQHIHGHGTGIINTKRRLDILYPGHELKIVQEQDSYRVSLILIPKN